MTRPIPTPRDIVTAVRTAEPDAGAVAFDRRRWEQAVMASALHPAARSLAFVLAHLADGTGRITDSGRLDGDRLGRQAGLTVRQTSVTFEALTRDGFIRRPDRHSWQRMHGRRPITLTLPAVPAPAHREPPSTAQAAG